MTAAVSSVHIVDRGAHLLATPGRPTRTSSIGRPAYPYGLRVDTELGPFDVGLRIWRADCDEDYDPRSLLYRTERPDVTRSVRLHPLEPADGDEPAPVSVHWIDYALRVCDVTESWALPPRGTWRRRTWFVRGDRVGEDRHTGRGLTDGAQVALRGVLQAVEREITREEWRHVEEATLEAGRAGLHEAAAKLEARAALLRKRGDLLVASFW